MIPDARIPPGSVGDKWDNCRDGLHLLSPAKLHTAIDGISNEGFKELIAGGYLDPEVQLTPERLREETLAYLEHQPRNIMLLVTQACNLACTYCYEVNQDAHRSGGMLSADAARRIRSAALEGLS